MTFSQQCMTIALCALGTMLTRFLPFLIFSEKQETPVFVQYLGKALPAAIFGMFLVYCLKNVSVFTGRHGVREIMAIAITVFLHLRWKRMLVSIGGGTIAYMLLIQFL